MTLNPVEKWIAEHVGRVFILIAALMLIGAGLIVYFVVDEQTRLAGVRKAGPCRAEGIKNPECREQARLIFKACSDQPERCARLYGISVRPWIEPAVAPARGATSPGSDTTLESGATSAPSTDDVEGGGAQQPKGNQQPGPGSQPGQQGDQGEGHSEGHSPGAEAPSGAPQGGKGADTPADTGEAQESGDNGSQGGSSSGAGVEVCVAGVTCVEAEVGLPDLKPKGLNP